MNSASAEAPANLAWADAWERELAALEMDVDEVEALLVADHSEPMPVRQDRWAPPTGLGPLPVEMRDRAQALLARQIDVASRLAAAAQQSRRHLNAVEAMRASPPAQPTYFDTEG